ncbi:hypothetical protein N7488_001410 [Penicillium malachiteum]|nr:hypothetical protein N7488_001410 [Penicillium malachiteum]
MDDVQSTAKWANRMLRPLTSIYRRLEKHHETLAIIAAESRLSDQEENINEEELDVAQATTAPEVWSDADEDDPVWVPGKKPAQRRTRHRYSGREESRTGKKRARVLVHSPEAPRVLPGAIEVATPLITGRRWEIPSSARSQPPAQQTRSAQNQEQQAFRIRYSLHKSPWQELFDQSADTGFADIAHNLDRILQNFLSNTRLSGRENKDASVKPRVGARSLLSMVLRRLPDFIEKEQEEQDELDKDAHEDMCDAYFTELEAFYASHGRGWKPLREAVRAQGIHLVSTMIENKWLTDPIACALIEKCRHSELDAFESLLSTLLSVSSTYPFPQALKPSLDNSSLGEPLRLLHRYASHDPSHRSYVFQELTKLLGRGVLPPEWMATKPWTHWMTRATISFSRGDGDSTAASMLIETVLVSASDILSADTSESLGQKRATKYHDGRSTRNSSAVHTNSASKERRCPLPVEDALSNQVTSLLAALCGMHISRSREFDDIKDSDGTQAGHIINHVLFSVKKEMNASPLSDAFVLSSHHLFRRGCILLAGSLLQCNDAVLADNTEPVVKSSARVEEYSSLLASRSDLVKELALFVRQSFRCFGSTSSVEENTLMASETRRIVSRLPYLTEASGLAMLLSRVAVEAAMEFAEATGEPDDHLWAVEIQETAMTLREQREKSSGSASEADIPSKPSGLFRWEDSIGEWVARTPAVKPTNTTIGRKRRASQFSPQLPCIPCSTDSSCLESDSFEKSPSSVTSSPSSVSTERNLVVVDTSPIRPAKRRRTAPMVVVDQAKACISDTSSERCASRSPSLEPIPSHRRILRDMSNRMPDRTSSIKSMPASKVEVVIVNNRTSRPAPVRSETIEKRVHRPMGLRRQSTRESVSRATLIIATRRRSVIPCSQDDSDDELSFM